MKTYNATNRRSPQLKKAIKNTLEYHEKYKNSYFWSGTGSASQRQSKESHFSAFNPAYRIVIGDDVIEVEPSLSISCKNYYYKLYISKNGRKKDIRELKKLLK